MNSGAMEYTKGALPLINRRSVAPRIKEPVEFTIKLPGCEHHVLSNGVEVYTLNMGDEDTMMVNWVFFAGNWYEKKKTVAIATNFLLKNGTSSRTAFNINEHFDYYGSYLNRQCYHETAELVLHCLNKHVPELLPVVAELLTDSVFPEDELGIYKQNAKQRLKVNLQKCEFVAGQLIEACLFGEQHPYGRYNRLEDYDALQREEISSFYDEYYRRGRCIIFASGKLPTNFVAQLEQYFGHLPFRSHRAVSTIMQHEVQSAAQRKFNIINDETGVQAAIRIARSFPNRHHPDFQKAMVLNNVFGGFFGSRLMSNIREQKGFTYGIYSYLMNHLQLSGWMVSTEAGRAVSEATVQEVYHEMKRLREEPIGAEELLTTRNFMIGSLLSDLDGPFQVLARWKNLIVHGLDEEYFYRVIQNIKTVSAEDLHELANKYLHPDDFFEMIVI